MLRLAGVGRLAESPLETVPLLPRGRGALTTKRKPPAPTTEAVDQFCAYFDELLTRYEERTGLHQYLTGLLLLREHNKTLVELGAIVPGANRQALHHFMHDAPRDGVRSIAGGWRSGKRTRTCSRMRAACSSSTRRAIPNGATASSWPPSSLWASWGM